MSRFNYTDDEAWPNQFELWHANTDRCLAGRKGQHALREFETALLALPEKRLISGLLYDDEGSVCAVGAYMKHKRLDLQQYDPEDETDYAGEGAGLPYRVAWKLVELNDMEFDRATPEQRYERMLAWVRGQIKSEWR